MKPDVLLDGAGGTHKFYSEWESRLRGKVLPKFSEANFGSRRACWQVEVRNALFLSGT